MDVEMDIEMVLNELSLQTLAPDIPTAKQWMSNFIQTLRKATSSGVKRVVRTQDDMNGLQLAPEYPLAKWRNDPTVNREERSFFRLLTTKAPFWTDVAEEIKSKFDLSDVFYQGKLAPGLGFAWVSDSLAVSLLSEQIWDEYYLRLEITKLDEDNDLIEEQLEIVHASRSQHIKTHTNWIQNRIRTRVKDGVDLWQRQNELFPHLKFCQSVGPQICNLLAGDPMLTQVKKRLFDLEEASQNWKEAGFNLETLSSKATPESNSRLQNFKNKLTIQCPDRQSRLFSLHLRMTPGAWRIYFFPLTPGSIIIGYVGHKIL
ncbi:hypothetical protein [Oxynema aestuarii]|jgi:hypothetical protein|nr:hypothetical protein [Oxynema aestuarii]